MGYLSNLFGKKVSDKVNPILDIVETKLSKGLGDVVDKAEIELNKILSPRELDSVITVLFNHIKNTVNPNEITFIVSSENEGENYDSDYIIKYNTEHGDVLYIGKDMWFFDMYKVKLNGEVITKYVTVSLIEEMFIFLKHKYNENNTNIKNNKEKLRLDTIKNNIADKY